MDMVKYKSKQGANPPQTMRSVGDSWEIVYLYQRIGTMPFYGSIIVAYNMQSKYTIAKTY